jgi:hypothetical protein
MPFKKGNTIRGSRKNKPNKRTQRVLKSVEFVLNLLDKTIEADIQALRGRERSLMWQDLQEFIRPKLARTEHTGKEGETLTIEVSVAKPKSDAKSQD